jgi:hypothetical protein
MKDRINFRTAYNKFAKDFKQVCKEEQANTIYKVHFVFGTAFKNGYSVSDEYAVMKAIADMEKQGIKVTIANILIHKTKFE